MLRVIVDLRHWGQHIRNLESNGPTPSATFSCSAHSKHRSWSQISYTIVLPYFLQFKHGPLIIIILVNNYSSEYISYHWAKTSTESTAESSTRSSAEATKPTEIGSIRIEACPFWSYGNSELVKAYKLIWDGWIVLNSKWIIKRINRVISCSRWNNHIAWHSSLVIIRIVKNLTIRPHILLLSKRIHHLWWINKIPRRIDSLNIGNNAGLWSIVKAIILSKINVSSHIIVLNRWSKNTRLRTQELFEVEFIVLHYRLRWIVLVKSHFVNFFGSLVAESYDNFVVIYCKFEVYDASFSCVVVVEHVGSIF